MADADGKRPYPACLEVTGHLSQPSRETTSLFSFFRLPIARCRLSPSHAAHNLKPERYVWEAEGKAIMEKIRRARQKLAEESLRKPVLKTGH